MRLRVFLLALGSQASVCPTIQAVSGTGCLAPAKCIEPVDDDGWLSLPKTATATWDVAERVGRNLILIARSDARNVNQLSNGKLKRVQTVGTYLLHRPVLSVPWDVHHQPSVDKPLPRIDLQPFRQCDNICRRCPPSSADVTRPTPGTLFYSGNSG